MRIQSKFKDYYDYVEFLYSPEGGDPSNLYLRRELDCGSVAITTQETLPILRPRFSKTMGWSKGLPWDTLWCCICGKLYLLVAPQVAKGSENALDVESLSPTSFIEKRYKLIEREHPILKEARLVERGLPFGKDGEIEIEEVLGRPNELCKKVSEKIGEPIFLISYVHSKERYHYGSQAIDLTVEILPAMPNLGKLGFASVISAEQMYQDLATFLNQIRDNPDKGPPVEISEIDRLRQKGYDSKVSFRGVNQKRK